MAADDDDEMEGFFAWAGVLDEGFAGLGGGWETMAVAAAFSPRPAAVKRAGGGRARGFACPGVDGGRRGGGQSSRWGKLQFGECECVRGVCWRWYERALPWGSQPGRWNVPA